MVKVDISQITEQIGGIQSFTVVASAQDIGEEDPWFQGSVSVSGQIANVGTGFRLAGNITATANFECSRCLKPFEQSVKFQFEEDFDAESEYTDDWIDIAEPIRAALIFQEPMQPLCIAECKGLCVHCGVDRNLVDCDCDKKQIDPRLAALSQLLE